MTIVFESSQRPERHGHPWTAADEAALLDKASTGEPLSDIATCMGRSRSAIRSRLMVVAARLLTEGADIKEVSTRVGLSVDVLLRSIERRKAICFGSAC